ncbi:hypothetical protein V1511DRAFT_506963 [Dipodascopsis uninucleata]
MSTSNNNYQQPPQEYNYGQEPAGIVPNQVLQQNLPVNETEDFAQPGKHGVVDIQVAYRSIPSNGLFFGPYLRYGNIDLQTGIWSGSVMIVVRSVDAPLFQIHPSLDIGKMGTVEATLIYQFEDYRFFRYNLFLPQRPGIDSEFWTYAITLNGQTLTYQFLVAGAHETTWRFMAFSCADFSLSVKSEEREELGGVGYLWKDVLNKHKNLGGLHAMLGGGDQIYADRMWSEVSSLRDWLNTKGKLNRRDYEWTDRLEQDINLAYFFFYSNHFDRPGIRDCLAQIPNVFQIDDHDIFDGFGSYPDYMQNSNVFVNIGRIAFHFYLLFQHHTTEPLLLANPQLTDLFTVTGRGWHFIKLFGPQCAVIGPDTRAERRENNIIGEQSYNEFFARIRALPPSIKHIVFMLAVPIVYPRLAMVEHILSGVKTIKRATNGAWNMLGKASSKVASVVGAKESTTSAFEGVKKAFGKSGLMSSLVSGFGEIDLLDDLADHWTHENHATERTYFVRNLQRISMEKCVRITFVSGDVHCCGMGKFYNPEQPENYQMMVQVITSAISNVPPPSAVIRLLHDKDKLYLPEIGGKQSPSHKTDTREEMIEFFDSDVDGKKLDLKKLLGRRNYSIAVIEPDSTMAWDLYVQKGGRYGTQDRTHKYGPLVVTSLATPAGPPGGPITEVQSFGPGGLVQSMNSMNLNQQ